MVATSPSNDHMGAGDSPGMQPSIVLTCNLERDVIILDAAPTDEDVVAFDGLDRSRPLLAGRAGPALTFLNFSKCEARSISRSRSSPN